SHDTTAPTKTRRSRSKPATEAKRPEAAKVQAKPDLKQKVKKPVKAIEDIDLDAFEEIETLDNEKPIEELEEIEDIDTLEELEEIEEPAAEEEAEQIPIEASGANEALIDGIEEGEEGEEDDEDDPTTKHAKKTKAKPKKGKK